MRSALVKDVRCPLCGSEETHRGLERRKWMMRWYLLSFVALQALTIAPLAFVVLIFWAAPVWMLAMESWVCLDCGLIWKDA
jgi:hypothetical protein